MTHSENENDHFDLDHFDHILATPFFLSCNSYVTLMLLLCCSSLKWELYGIGIALAFALSPFYLRFRSVVSPFPRIGEKGSYIGEGKRDFVQNTIK